MEPLNLASIAEIGGKYTSQRSVCSCFCISDHTSDTLTQINHFDTHSAFSICECAFYIVWKQYTALPATYMPAKKAVIGYFRFFLTLGCLQKEDFNFYCNYNSTEVSLC